MRQSPEQRRARRRALYQERKLAGRCVHCNAVAVIYGIARTAAVRTRVAKVAVEAWAWAHHNGERRPFPLDVDSLREEYAEAEALLRTGWEPEA